MLICQETRVIYLRDHNFYVIFVSNFMAYKYKTGSHNF